MDTPTLVPFKIFADAVGGRLEVDGVEPSGVRGVEIVVGFNEPTRLVIHQTRSGGVVEGLAHVTVASTGDPASAVRALDPGEVCDRCANGPWEDMSSNPYTRALDVIAQMLDEQR